jgi:hypothetical protein
VPFGSNQSSKTAGPRGGILLEDFHLIEKLARFDRERLMGAAFKGYVEAVDLLLQQPCAVDQSNGVGQTALMFARLFGRKEVAERLRQQGASPERRDASGRTADDWARTQAPESPVEAPSSIMRSAAPTVGVR